MVKNLGMIKRIVIVVFAALTLVSLVLPWVRIETLIPGVDTEFSGEDLLEIYEVNIILVAAICIIVYQFLGLFIPGVTATSKFFNSFLAITIIAVIMRIIGQHKDRVDDYDWLTTEMKLEESLTIHLGLGCLLCLLGCLAIIAFSWVLRDDRK